MKSNDFSDDRQIVWLTAAFGLLLLLCLWASLYYKVQNERRAEIDAAIKETGNLAIALEENTVNTIKSLDHIVMSLKQQYEKDGKAIDIPKLIREGRFEDQPYIVIGIVDENGDLVASSQERSGSTNVKDREHFQVHQQQDRGLYIGKPVLGKVSGKWSIQLTRRVVKPDGSFGGVVAVAADPYYFAEFYKRINLGAQASVALTGLDGVLRVRQSGDGVQVGVDFSQRIEKVLEIGSSGSYIENSVIDGTRRIYSFRTMQNYPLVVAVGETEEEALKDFYQRVRSYYWVCGIMSTLIIGFCVFLLKGIARRRKAEAELCRVSTRLAMATRAGGVGVWEYDVKNNRLIWDAQMFALYGIEEQTFSGAYDAWRSGLHPEDVWRCEFETQQALSGEQEFNTEFRVCWPDGSVHTIRALAHVERDRGGSAIRMTGTNWDITAQKETERKLQESNRKLGEAVMRALQLQQAAEAANIAKSNFLANMSHEIRTPMNGVIGFMHLLETTELTEDQAEYVRTMRSSAELLMTIINDILDLSKIEAGKMQLEAVTFDLPELVHDAATTMAVLAEEKGLALNMLVERSVPRLVVGDPTRLKQVLTNFISNAVKFTASGEVLVEVVCNEQDEQAAWLQFFVRDTGIGLSDDARKTLFRPFVQADNSSTRKFGGTGLGLAISKSIVELMGGEIGVQSEVGKGSTFFVAVRFPVASGFAKEESYEPVLAGVSVLVVAAQETVARIVRSHLECCGARIEETASAAAALEQLTQPENEWGLLVIDNRLSDMTGEELIFRVRRKLQQAELPIILLKTKNSDSSNQRDERQCHLVKPYSRRELLRGVALLLNGKNADGPKKEEAAAVMAAKAFAEPNHAILLVEDNEVNQRLFVKMLQVRGLQCDLAADGEAAVAACQTRDYELVFMDCQMPVMDGYEATRRIREWEQGRQRHVHIVALTAYAMSGDLEKCKAAGMDDYVSKPIELDRLLEMIEKYCGRVGE